MPKTNDCFNCGNSTHKVKLPMCCVGVMQDAEFEECSQWKPDDDICQKCGKEINLALPHDYDRVLKSPIHRECRR